MAATYEFYSSTATDARSYGGSDWARFFRSMFTSGIEYGKLGGLAVTAQDPNTMAVDVATGSAWLYGDYMSSDDVSGNAITAADPSLNRIDRVVARNTIGTGITLAVLTGTPDASPVAPSLTTDGVTYYDTPLAQVLVTAGVTEISGNATTLITDERTYSTLKFIPQASILPYGNLDAGNNKITELANGVYPTDLINKGQCDDSANFCDVPVGSVVMFGTTSIPSGFLACDGTAVSRTTYADLFTEIGVLHGNGDGSTTFNVPNLTDKIPVGYDADDSDFYPVGKTGGAATVTVSEAELPAHTHGGVKTFSNQVSYELTVTNVNGSTTAGTTGATGGGGAHNNLAPYIKMAWGIKT